MPAPRIPNTIDCGICSLQLIKPANEAFIVNLFQAADVKKFYVLTDEHASDIRLFFQYMLMAIQQGVAIDYIIYNNYGEEVGLISAEAQMNQNTGMPMWNIGYAISPRHRRRGYASAALHGLTNFLLQNFSIPQVMLDICTENHESEGVARKCGFRKPDDHQGYMDFHHMELGMRFRWFKQLAGQRTMYFNKAVQCYRMKAYAESVQAFRSALSEPYQPGTPYTDAQIYSNMGMALSSIRDYRGAFNALKKAQALGLNNPSIEKELRWLRDNQGLY